MPSSCHIAAAGLGRSMQVPADLVLSGAPSRRMLLEAGGSSSVTCFRAGLGDRGRKAGEVPVAWLRRLLACFSEAMLCL